MLSLLIREQLMAELHLHACGGVSLVVFVSILNANLVVPAKCPPSNQKVDLSLFLMKCT